MKSLTSVVNTTCLTGKQCCSCSTELCLFSCDSFFVSEVISLSLLTAQPTSITCRGHDHQCLLLPALVMKVELDYFTDSCIGPCSSIWLLTLICLEFLGHEFWLVSSCVCKPSSDWSSSSQYPLHPHLLNHLQSHCDDLQTQFLPSSCYFLLSYFSMHSLYWKNLVHFPC